MLVDTWDYLFSMLQVYGAALILIWAMPRVMWRKYLKNKSPADRFFFCVLTQSAYLVNLVLLLGLLRICSGVTVLLGLAAEYALVSWTYSDKQFFRNAKKNALYLRSVIRRENTAFSLRMRLLSWLKSRWRGVSGEEIKGFLRRHGLTAAVLAAALIYNAAFLTHNVRIYHSYQFSDLPVHQSWVYALEKGTLFVDGIYPFAMHAVIYAIRALFGLDLREIILNFGSFQSLLFLIGMFILSRRIFAWKYSGYFFLVFFSILLTQGRFAASLPQEGGMFAVPAMAYYMLRYLETERKVRRVKGDSRLRGFFRINQYLSRKCLNFDIWMLMLSVSLIIAYHFYTAIAAIVLAGVIGMAYFFRFFKKQYLVPIAAAAVAGAVIAVAPFGLCYFSGIPFHGSMAWAMSVIDGTTWEGTGAGYLESLTDEYAQEAENQQAEEEEKAVSLFKRGLTKEEMLREFYETMRDYMAVYILNPTLTALIMPCMGVSLLAGAVMLFFKRTRFQLSRYLAVIVYCLIINCMGAAGGLGFVIIFDHMRASVFEQPFLFYLLAIPLDAAFALLSQWKNKTFQAFLAAGALAACGLLGWKMVDAGMLHHAFDVNLAYYNEPDYLIKAIRRDYPSFQYTIVSPTDEYYAVVVDGYHTELSEFVNMADGGEKPFKFPTPYVFFFIEKYTMQDYFKGQAWVDQETAKEEFQYRASTQDYYYQRNVIESKAYYWALKCRETYPNQMRVYFEDDIYIAYVLTQDVNYPLDLRLDYLEGEE